MNMQDALLRWTFDSQLLLEQFPLTRSSSNEYNIS